MIDHHIRGRRTPDKDANPDAKAGVLGAHPVGVGSGAIDTGAAPGAAGDTIAGPVGALAGNSAAEVVSPTVGAKH